METTAPLYMQRCLQLGAKGLGKTAPNPLVGCVIVADDRIIGEGFHEYFGGNHAEVNAINDAISNGGEALLKKATLYVNLEPCSHYGKTPPCTEALIRSGIPRVVIGSLDPFEDAAGRGIKRLQTAGIEVIAGICKDKADVLNKRFFTFHQKKRPYIIIKFAQSNDGFIAPADSGKGQWISNGWSRRLVHKWRTEEPGIMVGSATVLNDNPSLTARTWPGKQPVRIVIDRRGVVHEGMHVLDQNSRTIIFTCTEKANTPTAEFVTVNDGEHFLEDVFHALHQRNIQSILVEGGARLIAALAAKGLWDEARIFTSTTNWDAGIHSPQLTGKTIHQEMLVNDRLTYLIP